MHAILEEVNKSDAVILMGDMNAKVGNDNRGQEQIMGKHGLGTFNDNGELFMDACATYNLVIGRTVFLLKPFSKNREDLYWMCGINAEQSYPAIIMS